MKLGIGNRTYYGEFLNSNQLTTSAVFQFNFFSAGYSYDLAFLNFRSRFVRGQHLITIAYFGKGLHRDKGMSKFMNAIL